MYFNCFYNGLFIFIVSAFNTF